MPVNREDYTSSILIQKNAIHKRLGDDMKRGIRVGHSQLHFPLLRRGERQRKLKIKKFRMLSCIAFAFHQFSWLSSFNFNASLISLHGVWLSPNARFLFQKVSKCGVDVLLLALFGSTNIGALVADVVRCDARGAVSPGGGAYPRDLPSRPNRRLSEKAGEFKSRVDSTFATEDCLSQLHRGF